MVVTVDCRLFLAVMLAVRWLLSDNSQPDSISLTAKGISARKIQHNSQQKNFPQGRQNTPVTAMSDAVVIRGDRQVGSRRTVKLPSGVLPDGTGFKGWSQKKDDLVVIAKKYERKILKDPAFWCHVACRWMLGGWADGELQ